MLLLNMYNLKLSYVEKFYDMFDILFCIHFKHVYKTHFTHLHTLIIFKLPERAEIEFSINFSEGLFIKDLYFKSEGF